MIHKDFLFGFLTACNAYFRAISKNKGRTLTHCLTVSAFSNCNLPMCGQGEGEGPRLCFIGTAKGISPASGIFDPGTQMKPSVSVKITGDTSFDKNK